MIWSKEGINTRTKRNAKCITQSVIIAFVIMVLFQSLTGIVYVHGESMQPAYESGDVLIIKKWSTPQRGDVVTAYIEELDRTVLKRVLAIEGDNVKITHSSVLLNGQQIMEIGEMEIDVEKEFTVPDKHYFVIGDNYLASVDSREFGCVSKCNIQGIVISKIF